MTPRVVTRFKQPPRIIDPTVFAMMRPVKRCPVCRKRERDLPWGLSRHHVLPTGQGGDDVLANLMWACGHGTVGCHGGIHNHDPIVCANARAYLERERPDTLEYLRRRLPELGKRYGAWLDRKYPHQSP